jgi:hypothetical protein
MHLGQVWPSDKAEQGNTGKGSGEGNNGAEDVTTGDSGSWWQVPVALAPDGSAKDVSIPGREADRPGGDSRALEGVLPPAPVAVAGAQDECPPDASNIDGLFERLARLDDAPARPAGAVAGGISPAPQGVGSRSAVDAALRAPGWRYGAALSAFALGLLTLHHLHHRKTKAASGPDPHTR